MPVLPAVPSTISPPGLSTPRRSASRIMYRPARSFTDPPGLRNSAWQRMLQPVSSEAPRKRINGVLPMLPTKPSRTSTADILGFQEVEQQPCDRLGLLLLDPVSGTWDEVAAPHLRAGLGLHALEGAGHLVDAPVGAAGDEQRRDIDGPSGERDQFRDAGGFGAAPIPLQPALEAGSAE